MDIILHIGAHRTGTASFQDYLRRHSEVLLTQGIAYWGSLKAKQGLLSTACSDADDPRVLDLSTQHEIAVKKHSEQARLPGVQNVIISDADLLGTVGTNIDQRCLYPTVRDRLKDTAAALDDRVSTVVVSIRSLELYWCSALAHGISQGIDVPNRDTLAEIALSPRGWRDVIADISDALPKATIKVLPFEKCAGRYEVILAQGTGMEAPFDAERKWLNRTPTLPELRRVLNDRNGSSMALPFGMGRWNPFTNEEHAALREMYADDMMWLTAGADGRARLIEDIDPERAGTTLPPVTHNKGQRDELDKRQMARPG